MSPLPSSPSHPKYRPDIDGLRAIAVLAVVAFHAFPGLIKGGFVGVDVFFVISGYLISTIIFENMDRKTFKIRDFYVRRIKRIFPALILVLISCFAFGWFSLFADEFKQLGKHIAAGATFSSNFILWSEVNYFDNSAETKPLLHLWSLGVEEQFYIVWPLLLWLARKLSFNILAVAALVAVASFILNMQGVRQDAMAAFYSPQTRFWELLCGSLLAWLTLYKQATLAAIKDRMSRFIRPFPRHETQASRDERIANVLSLSGALLLAYGFMRINKDLGASQWSLIPVLGAVLIIGAGAGAWINRTVLSNTVAVWFGLISFPLYLWHWPLLSFARILESEVPDRSIRMGAVALSVALAWLTYMCVERPMRFGASEKVKVTALVLLMAFVGGIGYETYRRDGFEFRPAIKGLANNKSELVRAPATDQACLAYTGLQEPKFPYCRYTDAKSVETIAVIGDSHAHVAYPGIAEFLENRGVSTLLLANSGCPPFVGSPTGRTLSDKEACREKTEQLLSVVINRNDIRHVFIFTRGPVYNTGTEPITGDKDVTIGSIVPIGELAHSAQSTIDLLSKHGKSVYYITENPELSHPVESCIVRPFKPTIKDCTVETSYVLTRQRDYLKAFMNLKNATIINGLHAFCPESRCRVFDDDGTLLYADDDHLSIAGSRFQVQKLLMPFLDQAYH